MNNKYLIINADDFGMCHSVNEAVHKLIQSNKITSTTIMMPCPWVREAIEYVKNVQNVSIGIHLTFTSEWKSYKWGPTSNQSAVSSLVTKEGTFPPTVFEVESMAKTEEVKEEIIKQIELAKHLGIEPTHLDNHMGSLYGLTKGNSFLPIVFGICEQYGFPFRYPKNIASSLEHSLPNEVKAMHNQIVNLANEKGIMILDYLLDYPYPLKEGENYESFKEEVLNILRNVQPGISELYLHPALATSELKAINPQWEKRQMEYDLLMDPDFQRVINEEEITLISWKYLQDIQRS